MTFSQFVQFLLETLKEFNFALFSSMKPQSWLRRNWLWAAGGAFVTIHLATWLMQKAMKSAARSETALKHKAADDKLD